MPSQNLRAFSSGLLGGLDQTSTMFLSCCMYVASSPGLRPVMKINKINTIKLDRCAPFRQQARSPLPCWTFLATSLTLCKIGCSGRSPPITPVPSVTGYTWKMPSRVMSLEDDAGQIIEILASTRRAPLELAASPPSHICPRLLYGDRSSMACMVCRSL